MTHQTSTPSMRHRSRLFLSPPHVTAAERLFVQEAFESNWIAPAGPHIDAFETEFAKTVGSPHAVAVTSGTAALHLALRLCGVSSGDEVLTSTLTFCASVNPVLYQGGAPTFIDSERISWNLDPNLLERELERCAAAGRPPKALVLVHLYGQPADVAAIKTLCDEHGVILIEDAAESLGAIYHTRGSASTNGAEERTTADGQSQDRHPGTFGRAGIFSFNGNKIITTSGGGMLVTDDDDLARHARKLATQARDDAPHYEHSEIGYNYRMSNVLAGIGRGQLQVLEDRVRARRRNFAYYEKRLGELPGIEFMPEAPWGRHSRWLTCLTIDPDAFGADREEMRLALEEDNIEARPVWKPMHLQPAYRQYRVVGGSVSEDLFNRGLCLPSGSAMTEEDLERVCRVVISCHEAAATGASVRSG